jgi:hypothetical protein
MESMIAAAAKYNKFRAIYNVVYTAERIII